MRRSKKIKLIIFDSGEIILKFDYNAIEKNIDKFYSKHGVDLEYQHKLWEKYHMKANTGKIGHFEVNKIIAKKLGLPVSVAKEFMKLDRWFWCRYASLFKGEKQTLRRLKKEGYKLAVLSDAVHTGIMKRNFYKYHGIDRFFDRIFTSRDIGYMKPHLKAYKRVLKSFKVKPENAVFVCHDLDEIEGGKKAGLKVICFGDKHAKKAHFHAKKFSDIYKIIKEIEN